MKSKLSLFFVVNILLTIYTIEVFAGVFKDSKTDEYRMSPKFSIVGGSAKTKAVNFESSTFSSVYISKPILDAKYSVDVGWKNMAPFDHKGVPDTGFEITGYTVGVTKEIYKKRRLRVDAGVTGLAYKSNTFFLNNKVNQHRGYTWGVLLRSSVNFKVIALNMGLEWNKAISNTSMSAIYFGISFNLGPMFGF